jgi:hypothetical protein
MENIDKIKCVLIDFENNDKTLNEAANEILRLFSVSQRSELLAFKRFISKTPLIELELYSDEEFTDLYLKANCA